MNSSQDAHRINLKGRVSDPILVAAMKVCIHPSGSDGTLRGVLIGRADMVMDFGYQLLVATRLTARCWKFYLVLIAHSQLLNADSSKLTAH